MSATTHARWRCGTCGSSEHLHAVAEAHAIGPLDAVGGELRAHDDIDEVEVYESSIICQAPGCTSPDHIQRWVDGRWAVWDDCETCRGDGTRYSIMAGERQCEACSGSRGRWIDAPPPAVGDGEREEGA